jgi:hypothetical protein
LDGVNNGATLIADRLGHLGKAFHFDGSSNVEIPNDYNYYKFGKNFTICLWLRMISTPSNIYWTGIFQRSGYVLQRYENSNKLAFVAGFSSTIAAESTVSVSYEWEFVCGRINEEKISIHINGVDKTKDPSWVRGPWTDGQSISRASDNAIPKIGGDGSGDHGKLIGDVDEIKIYNRALSDEEILKKYDEYIAEKDF